LIAAPGPSRFNSRTAHRPRYRATSALMLIISKPLNESSWNFVAEGFAAWPNAKHEKKNSASPRRH
jgi:hypothetical protein